MTHAVFTIKAGSGYDDVPEEKYHFPAQYVARAKQAVGDLIIYYEPRRGSGRSAYVAFACVEAIEPDPVVSDHYYARISDYLNFDSPVPFRIGGVLFESALESSGSTGLSGDFRNAIRLLPSNEFEAILSVGFGSHELSSNIKSSSIGHFEDEAAEFVRPVTEQLVRRPFREAAFTRQVKEAYGHQCAFTGLVMRNGGGRSEVDAAHIKPVGDGHNGPDSVRNGLALSKTVHWMFDRGLIAVDSDFKILSAGTLVPEQIKAMFRKGGEIYVPEKSQDQPHSFFLEYHRNNIFKGAKV